MGIKHGTLTGYCGYACRCPECRRAQADHHREYYAAHRERILLAAIERGIMPGFWSIDELDALEARDHLGGYGIEYHAAHTLKGSLA